MVVIDRSDGAKPTVYGAEHFAELLASVCKVVEVEPDESFADPLVRGAGHELVTLLLGRQAATAPTDHGCGGTA